MSTVVDQDEGGDVMTSETSHFPFAEFVGAPRDIGTQHGEMFGDLIRLQLSDTLDAARAHGLTPDAALAWAREQLSRVELIGSHWTEEMQGVAHGAGLTFAEVLALQLRPGSGTGGPGLRSPPMPEGCTSFAAIGSATVDHRSLAGQNRDLGEMYMDRMVVTLLRSNAGPTILMHSVPGELGGTGINGHGVSVFANSLWAKSGRTWMAPPVLRRAMLEAGSAAEAVACVEEMDQPAVGNFLVADAERAFNLEILPEGLVVVAIDDGVYAHANNCTDESLLPYEATERQRPLPFSEGRRQALQHALERESGSIDVSVCRRLLSDESGRPEPVCRRANTGDPFTTVAGLIAQPDDRSLHISFGPPSEGKFRGYCI